jgi:hypothetical protein
VALASVVFAIPLQGVAAVEGKNRIHDLDQFFVWTLPPVWGRSVQQNVEDRRYRREARNLHWQD